MVHDVRPAHPTPQSGYSLAPIHAVSAGAPLRICVLTRLDGGEVDSPFLLLRELPESRVYLGAVCDAEGRIQEWVEIWVQTLELRDLAFSSYQERLTNQAFDQRWRAEFELCRENLPDTAIVTGMEDNNPGPVLIRGHEGRAASVFALVEFPPWSVCKDDAVLNSFGLPSYSLSPFRYLHESNASGAKTFLATAADAPSNSHVQGIERLSNQPGVRAIFNPQAGLIRVTRFSPLALEDYLQVLEGRAWNGPSPGAAQLFPRSVYAELQAWSANPKGMPFLLHGLAHSTESLDEVFFLKLSALRDLFREVRAYVKAHQLPLLNLTPASFSVRLENVGGQFPALWTAKCILVKPGQAHPLQIKSTEQKYFLRLGKTEPSPFLAEGLAAHSSGIGSIRVRNVTTDVDGVVLEGTLVAEDYLGLDPHDLLWLKFPLGQERLEFYAHVYTSETIGPREARFRTVPARLSESVVASLKRVAGTAFPRSPYEVWPLLSSPCDLFSLGAIAVRTLLVSSEGNLPVILDEIVSLARHLGKEPVTPEGWVPKLQSLVGHDKQLLDLISPQSLTAGAGSPEAARARTYLPLWMDTIALVLRLFPGAGTHSFCKSFGDVSPLALETVFDRPIEEFESLALRLRSVLAPSLATNEEIAGVLLEQLATLR